jgi:hypothetical protein
MMVNDGFLSIKHERTEHHMGSGWWVGTFCIFPYIGNNDPN